MSGDVAGAGALGFPVPVPRRRAALFLAVLAAAQLAWGGLYVWRTSFVFEGERVFSLWDDAMISMTYARNLCEGHGLVWNAGGERVQGYTNLGPTLIMAALQTAPVARTHASLLVQLLALLLFASLPPLAWSAARDLFPESAAAPPLAAVSVAGSASLGIWSLQGSDVAFVAPWLLAGLALLAHGEATRGSWPRALLPWAALGPLLRPDAALCAGIVVAGALLLPGERVRSLVLGGLAIAGALAVYLAFGWLYYGDPLPNTWYLKATGVPRGEVLRTGWVVLSEWLPRLLPVLGLAAAGLALGPVRRSAWVGAALVATTLAWSVWIGGDWAPEWGNRFVAPMLPVLLALSAGGAACLVDRALARAGSRTRAFACAALALPLALLSSTAVALEEWYVPRQPTMYHAKLAGRYRLAVYLRAHTPPDTSVGVHWAGALVYFAQRPGVDVLGKSDRHIARLAVPHHFPGHSKWDWRYVVEEARPDVILRASRGLDKRDDFKRAYYAVVPPGGGMFYLRRDSVDKLHDPRARIRDLTQPLPWRKRS